MCERTESWRGWEPLSLNSAARGSGEEGERERTLVEERALPMELVGEAARPPGSRALILAVVEVEVTGER
jgi:hypothetical protein